MGSGLLGVPPVATEGAVLEGTGTGSGPALGVVTGAGVVIGAAVVPVPGGGVLTGVTGAGPVPLAAGASVGRALVSLGSPLATAFEESWGNVSPLHAAALVHENSTRRLQQGRIEKLHSDVRQRPVARRVDRMRQK
jgi:hypothetical protein